MYKYRLVFYCFLSLLAATGDIRAQGAAGRSRETSLSFYPSYTSQDFRWSIAGNYQGSNPNIYSELSWKRLHSVGAGISAELPLRHRWMLMLEMEGARALAGTVNDDDYSGDNRTSQTYAGRFASTKGWRFDAKAMPAYQLLSGQKTGLWLNAGYGYSFQDFRIGEGGDDISVIATGLNSSYKTRMYGPLSGMNINYKPGKKFSFTLAPRCQWLTYSGLANWNLVTDFQHPRSFEHIADGWEWTARANANYQLKTRLQIFLGADYRHLHIRNGDDVLYLSDGHVLKSHFNGAQGHAATLYVGAKLLLPEN